MKQHLLILQLWLGMHIYSEFYLKIKIILFDNWWGQQTHPLTAKACRRLTQNGDEFSHVIQFWAIGNFNA